MTKKKKDIGASTVVMMEGMALLMLEKALKAATAAGGLVKAAEIARSFAYAVDVALEDAEGDEQPENLMRGTIAHAISADWSTGELNGLAAAARA